jgi:hypothetical protein
VFARTMLAGQSTDASCIVRVTVTAPPTDTVTVAMETVVPSEEFPRVARGEVVEAVIWATAEDNLIASGRVD